MGFVYVFKFTGAFNFNYSYAHMKSKNIFSAGDLNGSSYRKTSKFQSYRFIKIDDGV